MTDPYRNLENLTNPAVLTWMNAQRECARRTLDTIPGRQGPMEQMQELDSRKAARVSGVQVADNDRYFYFKTRPQDQQPKLYCRAGYADLMAFGLWQTGAPAFQPNITPLK